MQEIIKLCFERCTSELGLVSRIERSVSESREHIGKYLESRTETLDHLKELIAFLDLNDKEWRERLEEDQRKMLVRVEELFLAGDTEARLSEPEMLSIGFAPKHAARQGLEGKPLSAAMSFMSKDRLDQATRNDPADFVEVFVKAGSL